jgi:ribosomal protein S27E
VFNKVSAVQTPDLIRSGHFSRSSGRHCESSQIVFSRPSTIGVFCTSLKISPHPRFGKAGMDYRAVSPSFSEAQLPEHGRPGGPWLKRSNSSRPQYFALPNGRSISIPAGSIPLHSSGITDRDRSTVGDGTAKQVTEIVFIRWRSHRHIGQTP